MGKENEQEEMDKEWGDRRGKKKSRKSTTVTLEGREDETATAEEGKRRPGQASSVSHVAKITKLERAFLGYGDER
jgi:hypothetical protein